MSDDDQLDEESEGGEVDAKEVVGFLWRSTKRHKRLSRGLFVVIAALAVGATALWPRTYEASVRLSAQRNLLMPALANTRRNVPYDSDAPTRGVTDAIMARDNIVALVKESNLVDKWQAQRAPILKLKDALTGANSLSDEDKVRVLVGVLEKQIRVTIDDSTQSITVTLEWPNAQTAYELVGNIEKNFLDERHAAEVSIISDAIAILEEHAKDERDAIGAALAELQRLRDDHHAAAAASATPPPAPAATPGAAPVAAAPAPPPAARPAAPPAPDPDLMRLIDEKRRQIREAQDARARHINELRGQLADLRAMYAPAHPSVVAMEKKIEVAQEEPQEITAMKSEERALLSELAGTAAGTADAPDGPAQSAPAPRRQAAPAPRRQAAAATAITSEAQPPRPLPNDEDAAVAVARTKLQNATLKYQELMDRIDGARIELETARAAFKYRYHEITPPEVPRKPKKPNAPVVLFGGLVAALLLSILACAGVDLGRGRFLEAWQVRRKLKIPVLGEVTRPS